MVKVFVSATTPQPSVDVRVSMIEPSVISAGLAVYNAFNAAGPGEKLPVPFVLQTPCVPPSVIVPFNACVALDAQTVAFVPASTFGRGVIASNKASVRMLQPLVEVSVSVTLPAFASATLGA